MPAGRDPDGMRWTVRRQWWPYGSWLSEMTDNEWLFTLGLILTLPLLVIWPFWLAARFFGAPWTLIVRRRGEVLNREQVVGWSASRTRMDAILRHVCRTPAPGDGPELPEGVTLD